VGTRVALDPMKVEPSTKGIVDNGEKQVWRYYARSFGIFSVLVTAVYGIAGAFIGMTIGASMFKKDDPEPGAPAEEDEGDNTVATIVTLIFTLGGAGVGVILSLMLYRKTNLMVLTNDTIRMDADDDSWCCYCIPCRHRKDALIHSMRDLMWWAAQHGPPAGLVWYVERAPFFAIFLLCVGSILISEEVADWGAILVALSIFSIVLALVIIKFVRTYHLRFGMQPPLGPFHEYTMKNQLGVGDDVSLDITVPGGQTEGNDLSCAVEFFHKKVLNHHHPQADHKAAPVSQFHLSQTLPGMNCCSYKDIKIDVYSHHTVFTTEKKVWWLPCCGLPLSVERRTVMHQSMTAMRVYRAGARSVFSVSWLILMALLIFILLSVLGEPKPPLGVVFALLIMILLCFMCAMYYLMDIIYKINNVKLTYLHCIEEMFRITTSDLQKFESAFVEQVGRVNGSGSSTAEVTAKTFPKNRWCCYSELLKDSRAGVGVMSMLCCCFASIWNCPASGCVCSDEQFAITTYRFQLTFTQKWLSCMTCGSIQNTFFYNSVTQMYGSHGWSFPACCRCCCQNTCTSCFPCLPVSMFGMQALWKDSFEAGLRSDVWEEIFEIAGTVAGKFCHSGNHNYSPVGEAVLVGNPQQGGFTQVVPMSSTVVKAQ